jgi:hypothetical protein
MRFITIPIFLLFSLFSSPTLAQAQALKVAAGNTLIGTANGALLGVSIMGLTNSSNLDPIRFGVGAGTLYGIGVAAYDMSRMDGLGYYVVEGTFNATEYSTLIVMLDTFYGSVTGSVLGMAVSLMANESVVKGIQYGASSGAIVGFGFGLVDAFHLSNKQSSFISTPVNATNQGLVQITGSNFSLALINPVYFNSISPTSQGGISITSHTGLEIAAVSIRF